MKVYQSILVIFTALFCTWAAAEVPVGTTRLKLSDVEPATQVSVAKGYVFARGQLVSGTCAENETLVSAACDAQVPKALGNERDSHHIFTRTDIVKTETGARAECQAVNLRADEIARLTISLNCEPGYAQAQARSN